MAVIKFVATIIIAICTLCTEMEAPMTNIPISTSIDATEVDTIADRPSTQVDDFMYQLLRLFCQSPKNQTQPPAPL